MRVALGGHGVDETHFVREFGQVGQHLGNHFPGLAARFEVPERPGQVAALALEGDESLRAGHPLAVAFEQLRFVVPGFEMAAGAGTKDHEDVARFGHEVRCPRGVGTLRGPLRPDGGQGGEELLFRQQSSQGDAAQAGPAVAQKIPAVQEPAARVGQVIAHG